MAFSSLPVYDVVLSSSSKDAVDFAYLLCKSLTSEGIRVLRGQEVEGDTTTTSQELAIQESIRVAIVILSRNYASSPRLLEELSQILERKRVSGISVLPVFYDVEPSDVRKQTGGFGESFNKNVQVFKEDPETVLRWRIALTEVANLSGWSCQHRNQTEIIKEIVNSVVRRREHKELQVLDSASSSISALSMFITRGFEYKLQDIRKLYLKGWMLRNIHSLGLLRNLQELYLDGELSNHLLFQTKVDFTDINSRTADIIEQPGDVEGRIAGNENINDHEDREGIRDVMLIDFINPEDREGTPDAMLIIDINDHEDREGTTDATSSAEWNFLLTALVLEIFSAGFDQASSPSKPHYALIGMLLAIAAVLACTWELIHKGSLVLKRWQQLGCFYYLHPSDAFFDSLPDIYGLASSISQCVFITVQYIYFSHHVDSPIKLSLLPAIFLMCLAGLRLHRNQTPSPLTNDWV